MNLNKIKFKLYLYTNIIILCHNTMNISNLCTPAFVYCIISLFT